MISDEITREMKAGSVLQNMILVYVREHPSVKLSAIERGVGASRLEVAAVIQELTQGGVLLKDEETGEYNLFL
jgi:DNA-binding IclR family transcriptional regulator